MPRLTEDRARELNKLAGQLGVMFHVARQTGSIKNVVVRRDRVVEPADVPDWVA